MRYYNILISNAAGEVFQPNSQGAFSLVKDGSTFTSRVKSPVGNGLINDTGAPNIEFDVPIVGADTPQGKQWIRIHGVGLKMISQSANLNNQYFKMYGGMAPGLPLATAQASQAGLLMSGQIYQAFGNWQGTDQTLELVVSPGGIVNNGQILGLRPPRGISFSWQVGQTLGNALNAALTQGFPGFKIDTKGISPNLYSPPGNAPQYAGYGELSVFAEYIANLSLSLGAQIQPDYPGVTIAVSGGEIKAFDGTVTAPTINLQGQDLIGQPTWLTGTTISFKTVLRADIVMGSNVKFPANIIPPYALLSPNAAAPGVPARSKSAFQGTFTVLEIHHFANFRQPDGDSWSSSYVAVANGEPSGTSFVQTDLPGYELPGFYDYVN